MSSAEPQQQEVRWRVLRTGMWAARRDDRHLGTVERGRRWLAVDADSEPIGRFRTLLEAQEAVTSPVAHRVALAAAVPAAPPVPGAAAAAALAVTACVTVVAGSLPVLAALIR